MELSSSKINYKPFFLNLKNNKEIVIKYNP